MLDCLLVMLLAVCLPLSTVQAGQSFAELVGNAQAQPMSNQQTVQVPFITWGGDVATFHANGGLTTTPNSIYGKLGISMKLVNGDDFPQQVKDYMAGKSPFLRGTMRMLGQASQVIGTDARTRPVVFLQLTWSQGDHIVSRDHLKTLNDLKGKKIAIQQGGPHVGMLADALKAAGLGWNDIHVIWTKDLTGPNGPAERFRKDGTIDAACCISPDMIGLTGGLDAKGSGAEGTVRGAKVLVSTAAMSHSIADVYAVRKDFYDANKPWVERFVAGYIKASEIIVPMRDSFEKNGKADGYMAVLKMAQDILGKEVLPTLEVDAHGLLLDCSFVGVPGNIAFFQAKGNLSGFEVKQRDALDLAMSLGYANVRTGFHNPDLSYDSIIKIGGLTKTASRAKSGEMGDGLFVNLNELEDDDTLLSFTISFSPNQNEFSTAAYGADFHRAIELASRFGNAVIAVRGHADPTKTLVDLVRCGMDKGILKRSGSKPNYTYYIDGKPLDLTNLKQISKLIEQGAFDGNSQYNPRETMQAALNLSQTRAAAVREAITTYAKSQGLQFNASQVQPIGVGISEPLIAKPTNMEEALKNMRVEFRLVKVPAETIKASDFDF
jgi:hypothetical protein